jgi:hypothetical protein
MMLLNWSLLPSVTYHKPTQEQVGLKSHAPCCIDKEYTYVSQLVTPLHVSAVEFWRWLMLKENVFFAGVLKSWEEWEGNKLWVGARQGKMTTYSIPCKNLKDSGWISGH